jgi:hypothetical protein
MNKNTGFSINKRKIQSANIASQTKNARILAEK